MAPTEPMSRVVRARSLVGREDELARLRTAFEACAVGHAHVLVVAAAREPPLPSQDHRSAGPWRRVIRTGAGSGVEFGSVRIRYRWLAEVREGEEAV